VGARTLPILFVSLCTVFAAEAATPTLALRIPGIAVPPGGTAQIQIFSSTAATLVSGELLLNLDPTVFGPITAVDVFSSTGDQFGTADIMDRQVDIKFRSPTGGIGRLSELPVATVIVPVLSTAKAGVSVSISPTTNGSLWQDEQNVQYTVSAPAAAVTVGGSLSIASVTQGGGMLPAGSVVRVAGTGFTAATTVSADGVAFTGTQYISSQEVDLTLAAPADLTAKRIVATNPDGSQATFFSALRATNAAPPPSSLATVQPIFPQELYFAASLQFGPSASEVLVLRNPGLQPVDVVLKDLTQYLNGIYFNASTVTVPPWGTAFVPGLAIGSELVVLNC
jgi:hypothetical protein